MYNLSFCLSFVDFLVFYSGMVIDPCSVAATNFGIRHKLTSEASGLGSWGNLPRFTESMLDKCK